METALKSRNWGCWLLALLLTGFFCWAERIMGCKRGKQEKTKQSSSRTAASSFRLPSTLISEQQVRHAYPENEKGGKKK